MPCVLAQIDVPAGRWGTFTMFTPLHAATVLVCAGLIAAACVLGRRGNGTGWERNLRRGIAGASLAMYSVYVGEGFLPGRFDWGYSLPLHVCDVMGVIAAVALLAPARWARGLLYYLGLGLCTQGFITPIVTSGPAAMHFWLFFWLHTWVVGAAVYDLVVRGFRPGWADYRRTMLLGLGYIGAVLAFNLAMGTNYAYVGRSNPRVPTLVDHLGPWPWRVGLMVAAAAAVFALITLPWTWRRHPAPAPAA